jgi:hypothetical protein
LSHQEQVGHPLQTLGGNIERLQGKAISREGGREGGREGRVRKRTVHHQLLSHQEQVGHAL